MDIQKALRKLFPKVNQGAGPLPSLDFQTGWLPAMSDQPRVQGIASWTPQWPRAEADAYPPQPTPEQLTAALMPAPAPVPAVISPAQLREWLIRAGKLDAVNAALAAISDATQRQIMQSWFEFASEVRRDNPKVLALAQALGMTAAQIDDAFRAAAVL